MKSIATKLLISIGIATFFFSIFFLYQTYSLTNKRVREVVEQQASMALKFDLAIRKYVAENVRPVMYELLGQDEFMPETMSTSYVARTIFEDVQKEFPNYIIKFASDNPRNPVNQAGPEELKIIEYFNNNPHLKRWEGAISIDGEQYVSKFSPMRMKEPCLHCHGDPKDAPVSLLKRYGSTAGFYRPLGQVVGMDTIAIPAEKITEQLWSKSMQTFLVGGLGLILFFLTIIFTTRFIITNRLTMISNHFKNAAQQEDYSNINPIEIKGNDEIFDLAFSFNTLSDKLKSYYYSLEVKVKERTRELEDTNVQLRQEIAERKRAEEALRESEEKYKSLFKYANDATFIMGVSEEHGARFLDCNESTLILFGVDHRDQILGTSPEKFSPPTQSDGQSSEEKVRELTLATMEGHPQYFEWEHHRWDGTPFWVEVNLNRIELKGKFFMQAVVRDITERKHAEEEIKASLKEKEILLQEIHHRVKNNMQIISSLLRLQISGAGDEQITDALMVSQGRVQTMAFVHETLYGSDSLAVIDFKTYISKIAKHIFQTYKTRKDRVKLEVDTEDIKLSIEQATPLGLITNELVTNSLKYAFPENRSGEIVIRILAVEQDSIEFVFSDNGVGIPEGLDWRNTDSLGLQLVILLAEDQLDGTVSLDRRKGTHFTVKFRHEENQ